ncbi:molybdenum cofactor biosynthesis protein MoaE [Ghiorsea bivora]|uniref:molybdenum cofactor biosynthesis protein MoaE n=1 Tax=Ghiorsea bivora TaxID=1485545 RepID=UPI0006910717|nr:molybdenum cofactor biosynthesis protein MoaE [Ghiorsea bivora]
MSKTPSPQPSTLGALCPLQGEGVSIQEADFSVEEEVQAIKQSCKRMGGIVSFLGCARDFSEGRDVFSIDFEQYAGMAEKAMKALRDEALDKFDILGVRMVHRVTRVHAGEQIVLIVVGAEHRKPAFEACEWLIDELKKRVPIWKRETTPDGETWVTSHP